MVYDTYIYVKVITKARVLCLIYTHDIQGHEVPKANACISGKAQVSVL